MALILKNIGFRDPEGLLKIIELYNRGEITPMALSSELTLAAKDILAFNNDFIIEVIDSKHTTKSFGMALLPETNGEEMNLSLYIDKELFKILSSKQMIEAILAQLSNYTKVTLEFARFNTKTLDFDVDLNDALVEALKLYKISLQNLKTISDLRKETMVINSEEDVDAAIEKLESGFYSDTEAKEMITVHNYLPEVVIKAAEDIVSSSKKLQKDLSITKTPVYGAEYSEVPEVDYSYKKLKAVSDDSYPLYQAKEIDPHYVPETNQ